MITLPFLMILVMTPICLLCIQRADHRALKLAGLAGLVMAIWALRVWDTQVRLELGVDRFNADVAEGLHPGPPGGGASRIFALYFGWLQAIIWIGLNAALIAALLWLRAWASRLRRAR